MSAKKKDRYIVCVDDEKIILNSLEKQLKRVAGKEYVCEFAESAEEAMQLIEELIEEDAEVVMVISDQIMPSIRGDELLVNLHTKYPLIIKILLTGQAALDSAVNAVNNADLFRYLTKPWDENDLILTVQKGLERYDLINRLERQVESFQRFVPRQFLNTLSIKDYESIKPNQTLKRDFTILFSDVRNFTSLAEKMGAQKIFDFLNNLFVHLEKDIAEYHGFVDKYIGDAVMAIFIGKPIDAIRCSVKMMKTIDEINKKRSKKDDIIQIGIGINSGSGILGVLGSAKRLDTTVIGDTVNISARLESFTKEFAIDIALSENLVAKLSKKEKDSLNIRLISFAPVRGKKEAIKIYDFYESDDPALLKAKSSTKKEFEKAVLLFDEGKMKEASALFKACLKKVPGDRAAKKYIEKTDLGGKTSNFFTQAEKIKTKKPSLKKPKSNMKKK